MSHDDGGATDIDSGRQQSENGLRQPSEEQLAFLHARQRRLAQGRGIRRIVALFDSIEELVTENDRRYDNFDDEDAATFEQVFVFALALSPVSSLSSTLKHRCFDISATCGAHTTWVAKGVHLAIIRKL